MSVSGPMHLKINFNINFDVATLMRFTQKFVVPLRKVYNFLM